MEKDETTPLLPPEIVINRGSPDETDISSESNSVSDASTSRRQQPVARKPFHYPEIHKARIRREAGDSAIATYKRYRYYNRLADPSIDTLSIPDHVVPPDFFFPFSVLLPSPKRQNSIVTIFSVWNTMMGTSLLSIPWAIQQAGFACGIAIMFIMGTLCFYTAFRIVSLRSIGDVPSTAVEFPDLCKHILGQWAEWISAFFSLIPLLGSAVVYWVLMSNFLYFTGIYIYDIIHHQEMVTPDDNSSYHDVYCPTPVPSNGSIYFGTEVSESKYSFKMFWDMDGTIPFYMAACLAPVISLKSPTFFTKFNAIGTLSVMYLMIFTIVKGSTWGIHFDVWNTESIEYVKLFQTSFPVLIGICSLAFFIHNCVLSIMRNQRHPEKNPRDLAIAYSLVGLTYLVIGVTFFATFPLSKECIQDNLLNNFKSSDVFAAVTRIFLLFQVLTLYPLIVYVLRVQLLHFLFGSIYPSIAHVLALNAVVLTVCILFAIFLPKVGTIIRFCGAFAGLVYIFTLPCLAYLKALKDKNALTTSTMVIHCLIMIFGVCSFIAQFVT